VAHESSGRHAFLVGAGILISRIVGLVRQRVISHYLGLSDTADAFAAALRVPNFLQNLFGEGVLSASFIPVYARLLAEGDEREADRVAGAVGSALALGSSIIVLLGMVFTPWLMWAIAPGYSGAKRELIILLVRILFPGTGLLVCSAWCLGILNSHRKFFLSYTAPVVWNLSIIATLLIFHKSALNPLAIKLAWGTVVGCVLQFAVQLPTVLALAPNLNFRLDLASAHVREVTKNFFPVMLSRGVVQVSAYIDLALASLLGKGAVAAMNTAQSIYTLPIGLFGMAVTAAELPAMSSTIGEQAAVAERLRARLNAGLRQIAFFIVPSAMAFFTLGDVITAMLYESGRFTHADSLYVWAIVGGSAVGLLASTLGRLYQSTYYAMRDTRTPLKFAVLRVVLTLVLGVMAALGLPRLLGIAPQWGAAGLTASAGVSGWVEFALLRRTLNERIGATGVAAGFLARLWGAAAASAGAAWMLRPVAAGWNRVIAGGLILGVYGVMYFAVTWALRVPECEGAVRRVMRFSGSSSRSRS